MKFWKCYGLLVLSLHNQVFVITDFFCTNATLLLRNESKELAKKRNDFWSQWGKNENVLEACVAIPASSFYLIMTIGLASSVPLNRFTSSERMSLFLFKTTECWAMIFVRVWLTWLLLHSAVSAAYSNTTPYNLGGPRPSNLRGHESGTAVSVYSCQWNTAEALSWFELRVAQLSCAQAILLFWKQWVAGACKVSTCH